MVVFAVRRCICVALDVAMSEECIRDEEIVMLAEVEEAFPRGVDGAGVAERTKGLSEVDPG